MTSLSVSIGSLSLRNPLILGSGPVGVRAEDILAYGRVAGAVITKSISAKPSRGSAQPRIAKLDRDGMINYEGGPNPGIEEFAATLASIRSSMECPIIGSISPRTLTFASGIESVAEKFAEAGVEALELDFKYLYDQAKGRSEFRPENMASVIERVRSVTGIPIIAKLAFGSIELSELAKAAEDGGASAISAINTVFPAMRINLRTRRPLLSMNFGGLSGAPIRPLAIAAIFRLRQATQLPLIGIGGVVSAEDAVEFLLAGANAVQVYTMAQVRGPQVFSDLELGLTELFKKMDVTEIADLVGAAHAPVAQPREDRQWEAIGG